MDAFHAQQYEPNSGNIISFSPVGLTGQAGGETMYELRPISTHLSERARRPPVLNAGNTDKSPQPISHSADFNTTPRTTTKEQTRSSLIHFVALCWCSWLIGWNDGTTGPLLPRIQERYNVGFTVVSLIFIGSCFGYITGAALNVWLNDRLGFGKVLVLGAVCQVLGYAIIIPSPPFALLVCAYVIVGFALAVVSAQANGFVASLGKHMSTKLGILHGSYGLGAFTAPFASTHFSKFADHRWAYHFFFSAGFSLLSVVTTIIVFRFRTQDEVLLEGGQEPHAETSDSGQQRGSSQYRQIFALKPIPLLIAFTLVYIGVEVTLGGWIVTFIVHQRHGGTSSGYISSAFFGGFTLGRVCLMWLNKWIGEHRVIIFYSLIAIILELTVWFVPSIVENAVALSLIGLVMGPMFPLLVSHMSHILPRWLLTACVGLVSGIGIAGSAALPLITGLLSSKFGIASLQPLMVTMMVIMLITWIFVPKSARRVE